MTRLAECQTSVSSDVVGQGTEVLTLDGEFDMSDAPELERRLSASSGPRQGGIVVDLRGVTFLDSTMLRVLVRAMAQAQEHGTRFDLIRPHSLVWRVFVLTGLSERFPNYSSIQEALAEA